MKAIASASDMPAWLESATCASLMEFIATLSRHAQGKPNLAASTSEASSTRITRALKRALALVDDVPAQDKDHPSQRFGNRAFRTWHAQLTDEAPTLLADDELECYFVRAFGDATRLDFGTGHEVAFVMLMKVLAQKYTYDIDQLALDVFPAYITVVRKLRLEYRLEPAGSHGVWSLDDYHFLPFILGAAQMHGKSDPPRVARNEPVVRELAGQGYMYFEAVADVLRSKRGPFHEHSPLLYEISSLKTWDEVHAGLVRMWKGEVLAKFPVAQHFVFTPTLPATWSTTLSSNVVDTSLKAVAPPTPFAPSPAATADPMQRYFGRAEKDKPVEYTPRLVEGGVEMASWTVSTATGRISSELEIDAARVAHSELDFPFPEMFFGQAFLKLHGPTCKLEFSATNALKGCKLGPGSTERKVFKVAISELWSKRRDGEGKPIPTWREDFDWTFTTFYCGDCNNTFKPTPRRIDYEHLKQREPIVFATEVILFEDDLFDTGVVKLSVKVRVMQSCFFALCRQFLRVDNNFVRIVDARFYHLFGTKFLLRETSLREATFEQLGASTQSKDLVDPNVVAGMAPLVGGDPKTMECAI